MANRMQRFDCMDAMKQRLKVLEVGHRPRRRQPKRRLIEAEEVWGDNFTTNPFTQHWETSKKTEIPEFHRRLMPEEFLDWIENVEKFFYLEEVPESKRIPLVTMRLRGSARAWWQHTKVMRSHQRKSKITTWTKMKRYMFAYYLPPNHALYCGMIWVDF